MGTELPTSIVLIAPLPVQISATDSIALWAGNCLGGETISQPGMAETNGCPIKNSDK